MTSTACLCRVWGARAFCLSKSCLHGELWYGEEKFPWRVFSTSRQVWRKKVPGLNGREKKHMKQQHMVQVGIALWFLQHFCGDGDSHLWWVLTSPGRDMLRRTYLQIHADWPGSVCCFSQHPAPSFPLSISASFPHQWVVFWFGYFFGNRHWPLKRRIISCPCEFSPAWLSLSSTEGRLLTVFLLAGMALNTRYRHCFNLQQWKSEVISLK